MISNLPANTVALLYGLLTRPAPNRWHGHENYSGVSAHRQLRNLVLALAAEPPCLLKYRGFALDPIGALGFESCCCCSKGTRFAVYSYRGRGYPIFFGEQINRPPNQRFYLLCLKR